LNLGRRFVVGSAYLGAGQIATNVVNFFLRIAIARLLGPAEFGVYAFCFAINEFINIIGAFSMSSALIQAEEVDESDYDTAFAICAGLGLIGMGIAAAIAPLLWQARSFEAAGILLLMGVARLLRLLWQVPEAKLTRALRYARITAITTFVATVPNVAAVAFAWGGLGAWSLGLRDVLVTSLLVGLSLWGSGYRYRGQLTRRSWDKLMTFGRPMFVSRGLEILMERLDNLAVGALMGNRAAGLYHQSRELAESGFIATVSVERVSLNLYARMQHDPERLARAWALVNYFLMRVMMAGVAVLLVYPQPVVRLLLGDEWLEVAPLLRWLALYAGLLPLLHNVQNLCYGLGEVHRMVRVRLVQVVVFSGTVAYASYTQSLEAMAAGVPVVASDIPPNRELVVDGETGFLVKVGDGVGFAQFADRLLADRDLWERLSSAARQRVENEFSIEKMIEAHAALYWQVVEESA
jgi:O-antigen/teichoic acid export membrane protein